jgi:hypothetical protein
MQESAFVADEGHNIRVEFTSEEALDSTTGFIDCLPHLEEEHSPAIIAEDENCAELSPVKDVLEDATIAEEDQKQGDENDGFVQLVDIEKDEEANGEQLVTSNLLMGEPTEGAVSDPWEEEDGSVIIEEDRLQDVDVFPISPDHEDEDDFTEEADARFICPLSLKVLQTPVRSPLGHVFEAACIRQYLICNGNQCPITDAPLWEWELQPVDNEFLAQLEQFRNKS